VAPRDGGATGSALAHAGQGFVLSVFRKLL
jgi:hypothetical protein